jgi:hypothetical protein
MNLRQWMKEAGISVPLEADVLALGGNIAAWYDEQDEETRKLKFRQAIEHLWDIAMSLPIDEWGYLPAPDALRIESVIGSPGTKP